MPHGLPVQVDLPSWVQGMDDFIEGTIVEIRASWSPLVDSQDAWVELDDCAHGRSVLDLVLTDVRSVRGASLPSELTVRVASSGGLTGYNVPEVEFAATDVQGWHGREPTFTEGMRIGGPVVHNPGYEGLVFPTAARSPIYRVIQGEVQFMLPSMILGIPYEQPLVEPLQGLDPDALWAQMIQASHAPVAPLANAYRANWRFDDPDNHALYAGSCNLTNAEANAEQPCDDTGDVCP